MLPSRTAGYYHPETVEYEATDYTEEDGETLSYEVSSEEDCSPYKTRSRHSRNSRSGAAARRPRLRTKASRLCSCECLGTATADLVALAFDVLGVVFLDEDKFGVWPLWTIFLCYPMVTALLDCGCECCIDTSRVVFVWQLLLSGMKTALFMHFSSYTLQAIVVFSVCGGLNFVIVVSLFGHDCCCKDYDDENPDEFLSEMLGLPGVAVPEEGTIHSSSLSKTSLCCACCVSNIVSVTGSVNLIPLALFHDDAMFRTKWFEICAAVFLWLQGLIVAYSLKTLTDSPNLVMFAFSGLSPPASVVWRQRVVVAVSFLVPAFSILVFVLAVLTLAAGDADVGAKNSFENIWCWLCAIFLPCGLCGQVLQLVNRAKERDQLAIGQQLMLRPPDAPEGFPPSFSFKQQSP